MKGTDIAVSCDHRFSIGVERDGGRFYLSIPVSNRLVDYEERYEISQAEFELYRQDLSAALPLVSLCRRRQADDRLMTPPGKDRGIAM
ncbi:hypothetical protein FBZ87_113117 [Nitrospirillum amazonense]|uniref:Uncharacterized protein n=1 Tax=Nitrospirillum amazonense TaxID=28077 RepID=A0A560JEV8_9PROT|nr:hypothetical protein [Nitrospirillum amazonense]TWB67874.1 hypothetical protein FBZ87_113117 [Nitrospirillum amazonense]